MMNCHLEQVAGALDRITGQDQPPPQTMTEEQRKAITERMRRYWASRREGKVRSV